MNIPLTIAGYGSSLLGSLLPDIDTTSSTLGKLFLPFSTYLERKFGHRTITHSLLGCSIFSLAGLPLLIFRLKEIYFCFVFGVLSHVFLDAVNKSGVPLFYPNLIRAVIPANEKYRIFTASREELVFLGVLSGITLLVLPLNRIGVKGALHSLVKIPQSAVADYLDNASKGFATTVDFEGICNISQKRIKGRWAAISSSSRSTLILQSPEGKLYSIGSNPTDNIRALSIQSFKGKPIKIYSRELSLIEQPVSDIFDYIPQTGKTYILGYIKTYDKFNLDFGLDQFPVLKAGVDRIDFDYASKEEVVRNNLSNTLASEGRLLLMTFYSAKEKISPVSVKPVFVSNPTPSKVITLYIKDIFNAEGELKVSPNDILAKGTLLASQDEKRSQLTLELKQAQERLGITKADLDKLRIQTEQESQLKTKEDNLLNQDRALTQNKRLAEIRLGEARAKVNLAQSDVEKIEKEIASTNIYSPVNGKVLSMNIQHTTVTLRILTKEESYYKRE